MYGQIVIESIEELNEYVSDEQILTHYFGEFEAGHWYSSPFRDEEKESFIITFYNGTWVWRDFGIRKNYNNAVQFVMDLQDVSFYVALQIIYKDIVLNQEGFVKINKKPPKQKKKAVGLKIFKCHREWELEYWKKGKVDEKELEYYNVYPGEVWNNDRRLLESKKNSPFFVYLFNRVEKIWKGYKPFAGSKEIKFFANNVASHVQNWDELDKVRNCNGVEYERDILFITKSYKDCIVLNKLGYHAIAPHSESMFLDPWDITYLKTKFKYIYVFYDKDDTGVKNCIKFTNTYSLYYINVPKELQGKDPWDIVTIYSYEQLDEIINNKLQRDGIQT